MPAGMHLKSEGFASTLYDPQSAFTLKQYCHDAGLPYADLGLPVPLDTLNAYGLAFQSRFAPDVEDRLVAGLDRREDEFVLTLDDGETVAADAVVVAVGLSYFRQIPPALEGLGSEFITHSQDHHDLTPFKSRKVVVIGGGSSAIDLATLLHESGADAQLVARGQSLSIHEKMQLPRPLWDRLTAPMSGVGPGWRSLLYSDFPQLFHWIPEQRRLRIVRKSLGPSAGWFMKERFVGKVPALLGYTVDCAEIKGGRVNLHLLGRDGARKQLTAEHVVAATGYAPDVRRLPFLSASILGRLKTAGNTPVLSSSLQSTVPGLYFAGPAAANSFGPVLRFIVGAKFAAPQIANHIVRATRARKPYVAAPAYGDRQASVQRGGRVSG